MKTLVVALIILGTVSLSQAGVDPKIELLNPEQKNLFAFKADRDLLGAKVKLVHANGDVVTIEQLEKRKMIIDFCDVKMGLYTIEISKDDFTQKFLVTKDPSEGVLCKQKNYSAASR